MLKAPSTPSPATATPAEIVNGFKSMAYSRSMVRLDFRDYGERESYLQDRNRIRRQTRLLDKAIKNLFWRSNETLAEALLYASKSERLNFDATRQVWQYYTGQYTPTEIRFEAYRVAVNALRYITNRTA
jgi:hypothetical protein